MIKINDYISYLPKSNFPLSSEVFFIQGKENVYIYDVGNGEQYVNVINQIKKNKIIILSHFHPDHINNLNQIKNYTLYQSKNTSKYTQVETQKLSFLDEVRIIEVPSTHAKGCLACVVDEYLFLGDSLYPNHKGLYNVNAVNMQMKLIESLNIKFVVCSHHEMLVRKKEEVLEELKSIYNQRNPKESFISLES